MHGGSRRSFWYHVYNSTSDDPSNNVEPNIKSEDDDETIQRAINAANYKEQHLEILHLSSLHKHTYLSCEHYNNMLLSIGLLQK